MSWNKHRNDFSINTIIGPNTTISGDVEAGGFTRIDGNLRGNVNALGKVVVGVRARMRGCIRGTAVTIGGVVYGNVLASEGVIILATGLVLGDIITQRIQANEGCLIHGRVVVCSTEDIWNQSISKYEDAEQIRSALSGFPYHIEGSKDARA